MLPFEAFYRNAASPDGHRPSCKECDRKYRGRQHRYRRRPRNAHEGQHWCLECSQFKPLSEFDHRSNKPESYCKECRRLSAKTSYQRNRELRCAQVRDRTYCLAPGEYDALLVKQNSECAICNQHTNQVGTLVVDHDHAYGTYRELICSNCNKGLGHFQDNVSRLQSAINYLNRHE